METFGMGAFVYLDSKSITDTFTTKEVVIIKSDESDNIKLPREVIFDSDALSSK